MPTTIVAIPPEIAAQLDALADEMGSNSQEIALQAIRAFLSAENDHRSTQEALAELDRGEGIAAEQVREEMVALLEGHGIDRARQAALRSAVAEHEVEVVRLHHTARSRP